MDNYELTVIFTTQLVLLLIKRYIIFLSIRCLSYIIQLQHELHRNSDRLRYSSFMVRFQPLHFHICTYIRTHIHTCGKNAHEARMFTR